MADRFVRDPPEIVKARDKIAGRVIGAGKACDRVWISGHVGNLYFAPLAHAHPRAAFEEFPERVWIFETAEVCDGFDRHCPFPEELFRPFELHGMDFFKD